MASVSTPGILPTTGQKYSKDCIYTEYTENIFLFVLLHKPCSLTSVFVHSTLGVRCHLEMVYVMQEGVHRLYASTMWFLYKEFEVFIVQIMGLGICRKFKIHVTRILRGGHTIEEFCCS